MGPTFVPPVSASQRIHFRLVRRRPAIKSARPLCLRARFSFIAFWYELYDRQEVLALEDKAESRRKSNNEKINSRLATLSACVFVLVG